MEITGNLYCGMVISAACALDNSKIEINNLNVFPVPDGDTGTNMSLTMGAVKKMNRDMPLGAAADSAAGLMLRSARGNSGAILSLFFRGIAKALKGETVGRNEHIVLALERGTAEAYKAVMKPTEGTILTVMRVCSEEARRAYEADPDIGGTALFEIIEKSAQDALAQTPEMLPVLKQAGVVDAGGFGFLCVIRGLRAGYIGKPIESNLPDEHDGLDNGYGEASFSDFDTDSITFAYCTECIVDKNESYIGEDKASELNDFIKSVGDSAVFIDDELIIKLHIHTNDPGAVLTKALEFGSLASVKIENMKNQHTALSKGAVVESGSSKENKTDFLKAEKKYGFVTVCMGQGISDMFYDIGADNVVYGGQTMNPSTQDIVDAVLKTPSEYVFILPNNKNIKMVARQAAELVNERHAIVIPTETIPQGMAAMLAYNPDGELDEITKEMCDSIDSVTSMAVTYAVRDTEIDRFVIKQGQFLGMVENKIACVSDSMDNCIKQLTRGMTGASYITILYGEHINESDADTVADLIRNKVDNSCEI